jgi:hypothetical protein
MKAFKFFTENKINIEDDPLYHLNVYENMVLGLISYCYRMHLIPVGYQHQFAENGFIRHLVINDVISHDYFESRHVRIRYELYDRNGINQHTFHLAEDVFNEVMQRYENI